VPASTLADASKVMGNFDALATCLDDASPAGPPYGIQLNAGGGAFGNAAPLASGQLLIGSTGNPPSAGQLHAGPGITITNSAGGITISAAGSGTGSNVDWLNQSALVKPVASNFTLRTSSLVPAGAALTATSRGMLLSTTENPVLEPKDRKAHALPAYPSFEHRSPAWRSAWFSVRS